MGRLWPSERMEAIIGRIRYKVADSKLLAHDSWWNGRTFDRNGRNTFLYRSPKGKYFYVRLTMWRQERDYIDALSPEGAYELYEALPEHEMKVEEAFPGIQIEPA